LTQLLLTATVAKVLTLTVQAHGQLQLTWVSKVQKIWAAA